MEGEPLVILLVEDNPDHAELVQRSFEDHRVANRLVHVSDGEAALDYLFRRRRFADAAAAPRPHVILLDLRLPKVDGLEVLSKVKAAPELHHIPVVIITTSATDRDMTEAYDLHANSYLVKPVDFDQFTRLMDDLGFYWLAWNQHPWR